MHVAKHTKRPNGSYHLAIDTGLRDSNDDPVLREFEWAACPEGTKEKDYVAMQVREAALLARHEVARVSGGTTLATEGQEV